MRIYRTSLKTWIKLFAVALLLLGGCYGYGLAQSQFATAQLRKIAEQTALTLSTADGFHYRTAQWQGLPVSVRIEQGRVTHIGYSLFTPWQRSMMQTEQCDFLERLLLTSDLPEFYGKPFAMHLTEERIVFSAGSAKLLKSFCTDTTTLFQTTLENGRKHLWNWYTYQQQGGSKLQVSLSYPADAGLIMGMGMEEMEAELPRALTAYSIPKAIPTQPEVAGLRAVEGTDMYISTGDIFIIPELNSNRFYTLDAEGYFQLVKGHGRGHETLTNLCTGFEIPSELMLNVVMVCYGYRTERLRLPLRQYVAYCMAEGCQPYFGVIDNTGDTLTAELVMNNAALGYAHVMKLKCAVKDAAGAKGEATARLNPYVPMSNLKSLFDESEK